MLYFCCCFMFFLKLFCCFCYGSLCCLLFSPSLFKLLHLQSKKTHINICFVKKTKNIKTRKKTGETKEKKTEISQPDPQRYLFFAEVRGLDILYFCLFMFFFEFFCCFVCFFCFVYVFAQFCSAFAFTIEKTHIKTFKKKSKENRKT